ncbi:MAG: CBS domain-containing protein [Archaeoglobaceae archaeon]
MDTEELKELIQHNYEMVDANETVSKVVPMLEKQGPEKSHAIVVKESNKISGVIRERDLIRGSVMVNPHETKIKNFIVRTGIIDIDELTIDKVARRFVEDSTPFVLVRSKDELGLIYVNDFLRETKEDLEKRKIREIMNPHVITVNDYDSAAKALATMRQHGIDRLVVVEDHNKAIGLITGKDIVDRVISPRKDGRLGGGSGEKDKTLSIMVDSIMSSPLTTALKTDTIKTVVELMMKNRISSIVITKDGNLEGIVTKKDILETLVRTHVPTRYDIQLITKDVDLDNFEKQNVLDDVEKFLNKFLDFLGETIIFVYIKRHKEKFRGLPLIHVRLRLTSEQGVFFTTGESWGVEFAVNATLKKLEREVLQEKEIINDKRMEKRFYEEFL